MLTKKEKIKKLERYRPLLEKQETLKLDLIEFEKRQLEIAAHITPGELDKIRTAGGKGNLTRAGAYTERDALLEYLKSEKKRTDDEILEIWLAIDGIENLYFRNAVYDYFIQDMSYAEIGFQEKISEHTARWRRNQGLKVIKF